MNRPENGHVELSIRDDQAGMRLDWVLVQSLPAYSRVQIRRGITAGDVKVDGINAKPAYRLQSGQRVVCRLSEQRPTAPVPEDIPLDVLYEDDVMAVINKPAGMVVHPARGHWQGTLVSALAYRFKHLSAVGGSVRPGIVHRLDRDTTGVIVIAKTDTAHRVIASQFEKRTVQKEYICLCFGIPDRDRDEIDLPIGKHPYHRAKMAIRRDDRTSKPAQTFYEVVQRFSRVALLKVRPRTGRTHQIRLHLAHIGYPVLCDPLYGNSESLSRSFLLSGREHPGNDERDILLSRHALHARTIQLAHPTTGKSIQFEAPLPPDIISLLAILNADQTPGAG